MDKIGVWMMLGAFLLFCAIVALSRYERFHPFCEGNLNTANIIKARASNEYDRIAQVDFDAQGPKANVPDLGAAGGEPNGAPENISSMPADYKSDCHKCVKANREFNVVPAEEWDNEFNAMIDYEVKNYGGNCMRLEY